MMAEVLDLAAARDHTARLQEAGWESKERLGKRIWVHLRIGSYYSEEMALEIEARRVNHGKER